MWLTACAATFALIFVSGVFNSDDADAPAPLGQRLVLAPVALVSIWITIAVLRQGIFATPTHLRVRNIFRSFELQWRQIESIDRPPGYGRWRNAGIQIRTTDGRLVSANLYSAGPFNRPSFADDVVGRLRELQSRYGDRAE